MSVFDHLKKGGLHHQLGIPEGERIPEPAMRGLCHGSIGDHVVVQGRDVKITPKIKKRACFGLNFGYHK
jgi:hypothetical protein